MGQLCPEKIKLPTKIQSTKEIWKMGTIIETIQNSSSTQVRLMISDKNWLETSAVDQLKKTAELPGICCAIGMPDLHPGKGQPIGAAFISKNTIYPHLVGSDIGCGMGLWLLDTPARKVKIDRWEKKLVDLDDNWDGDSDAWLQHKGINITDSPLQVANDSLGTIGGGNHFAEIQTVDTVFDTVVLSATGLHKHSVVLLAHSGSRGLGQAILRNHIDNFGASGLSTITTTDTDSAASRYILVHNHAIRWAVENRSLIAKRFCEKLGVKSKKLLDVSHNMVTPLATDAVNTMGLTADKSERYWIHRKGASPTDMDLVMIPGSRGSLSYLVKPRCSHICDLARGGFSLAHGAGRKWKRSDVRGRLKQHFKAKDLVTTKLGSRVICTQRDLLYEEAPQAYKNIDVVVDDLVKAKMIDVVASFRPLITYKTRRKS
jgi:release factor H-coupled RctB family protein